MSGPANISRRDEQRVSRIADAMKGEHLDLLLCALPAHVLLLSGYFPVTGCSIAIVTKESQVQLIVPEDEKEFASHGWADDVIPYRPTPLDKIQTIAESVRSVLRETIRKLRAEEARIGFEFGAASEPSSYAAMHLFGGSISTLLRQAVPRARIRAADDLLARLAALKTPMEVERIRTACRIASQAFQRGSSRFRVGMSETHAAALVRGGFTEFASGDNVRAEGFAWCMSGPNSAKAAAAYARSSQRKLSAGDLVLCHANSHVDGYWTDITRTYVFGQRDVRQQELLAAVFAASRAGLDAIRPGVRASDVDAAARETLAGFGLAEHFKHSAGHGVGFTAISAESLPSIHPESKEKLEIGMVFNLEPAVYLDGYGGVRHCEMVAVREQGAELLTDFQNDVVGVTLLSQTAEAA